MTRRQGLAKSITHEADDNFACYNVSSHSMGSNCEYKVLQVISAEPPTS